MGSITSRMRNAFNATNSESPSSSAQRQLRMAQGLGVVVGHSRNTFVNAHHQLVTADPAYERDRNALAADPSNVAFIRANADLTDARARSRRAQDALGQAVRRHEAHAQQFVLNRSGTANAQFRALCARLERERQEIQRDLVTATQESVAATNNLTAALHRFEQAEQAFLPLRPAVEALRVRTYNRLPLEQRRRLAYSACAEMEDAFEDLTGRRF